MAVAFSNPALDLRPRSRGLGERMPSMRELEDELFSQRLPRPEDGPIMAAQRAILSDGYNLSRSRSRSRSPDPRSSVRERRKTSRQVSPERSHSAAATHDVSLDGASDSIFMAPGQMTPPESEPKGLSPPPPAPPPEKEVSDTKSLDWPPAPARRESRDSVPVPRRMSSLPEDRESHVQVRQMSALMGTQSIDFASTVPCEEDETEGEMEGPATRRPHQRRRDRESSSMRTRSPERLRSATPPPIGKPRTAMYDDFSDDESLARFDHADAGHANKSWVLSDQESLSARSRGERRPTNGSSSTRRHYAGANSNGLGHRTSSRLRTPVPDRAPPHHNKFTPPESRDGHKNGRHETDAPAAGRRPAHEEVLMHYDQRFALSDETGSIIVGTGARSQPGRRRANSDFDDAASVSKYSISRHSVVSGVSAQMPDFFGPGIFQVVLHNPATAHQLLKFSETRLCSENVEFLSKVDQYHHTLNDLASHMAAIYKNFVSDDSSRQLNISGALIKNLDRETRSHVQKTLPSLENLFEDIRQAVEDTVYTDVYPRFVRHQLTLSATRALASDRYKYQGLGDCFCLTNPNKADNPIVYASDGFVKVTGYSRSEIIPRNCRFLQGQSTDRAAVRRLKNAIIGGKESVELLLNYKKNGNPFWNLLYVAPLFDAQGRLAFFLGGQVNCSTTIHSNTDVMRVLSASGASEGNDEAEAQAQKAQAKNNRQRGHGGARRAILRAFGVKLADDNRHQTPEAESGMETKVLNRMEGLDLAAQMKEFYTAYSKYIIIRTDTLAIHFFSSGIDDMLNPANNPTCQIAGVEVFKFLRQHMAPQHQGHHLNDVKQQVRSAIRAGRPLSVELRLATRRSAVFRGDEKFVTHWTPVKDEAGATAYMVMTLAPTMLML